MAHKKGPGQITRALNKRVVFLSEENVMIPCAIGQDRWINNFATRAALPSIESTNKIIIFFSVHATFTLGTSHLMTSLGVIVQRDDLNKYSFDEMKLHKACQVLGCHVTSSRGLQKHSKITINISDLELIEENFSAL